MDPTQDANTLGTLLTVAYVMLGLICVGAISALFAALTLWVDMKEVRKQLRGLRQDITLLEKRNPGD